MPFMQHTEMEDISPRKFSTFLWLIKDDNLSLKTLVTSSILCECEKIYTGQNDCSTETEAND
jgi:hypothetical protein